MIVEVLAWLVEINLTYIELKRTAKSRKQNQSVVEKPVPEISLKITLKSFRDDYLTNL